MRKKSSFLVVFTLFVYLSFTVLSNQYLKNIEYDNVAANDYFSDHTLEVYNDSYLADYIDGLLQQQDPSISLNVIDPIGEVRKIAVFGDVIRPKITEGRFFEDEDFQNSASNYAIVSTASSKQVGEQIEWNGISYEIVERFKERWFQSDTLVFTNLKEADVEYSPVLKIDYGDNENLYQNAMEDTNIRVSSNGTVGFTNSLPERTIFFMVQILFCLSILVVMYFYVEDKREEIRIKIIFGYSFYKIYSDSLWNIFLYLFVTWIITALFVQDISSIRYLLFAVLLSALALYVPTREIAKSMKLRKKYENKVERN